MAAGDLLQQLQQVGSALGPIAAGGVGLLIRAVKSVAAGVDEAKAAAKQAAGASQEAEKASKTAVGSFEAVSRAMRMELDTFKQEVEQKIRLGIDGVPPVLVSALARFRRDVFDPLDERLATLEQNLRNLDRMRRASRPDFGEEEETTGRFQGLSSTLVHEQEERRALQETLTEHMKDEAQRWMTLERTLGRFEALIETWESNRQLIETQIQTVQSEVASLRRSR